MLHIIKNRKGKFELVAVAKNGDYLVGSKQGYERKAGVYKAIRSLMKMMGAFVTLVQDDTTNESGVWSFTQKERTFKEDIKPSKKYSPKK